MSTQTDAEAVRNALATVRLMAAQLGDFMYEPVRHCSQEMIRTIDQVLSPDYALEWMEREQAVRKLVEAARQLVSDLGCPFPDPNSGCRFCKLAEALKPFAPAYERALEQQSAVDAGDAPVVRIPRP